MGTFDILIKNVKIVDGTGAPWFRGDIGIKGDTIKSIGKLSGVPAEIIIEGEGLVAAPGFIDPHSHADMVALENPELENLVRQGITTVVVGNCGLSLAPVNENNKKWIEEIVWGYEEYRLELKWKTFKEYLDEMEKKDFGVNMAHLVGHGTIRYAVMGENSTEQEEVTPNELEQMKDLVREAMNAGAYGMSTGLVYPPGNKAKKKEIIELAKVVAEYGGVYST
ncbi:aminoacylase, partial [bacterium]